MRSLGLALASEGRATRTDAAIASRKAPASNDPSLKSLFAAGVSEFAMGLRGSQYLPSIRGAELREPLDKALPLDAEGAVAEMSAFVEDTMTLK